MTVQLKKKLTLSKLHFDCLFSLTAFGFPQAALTLEKGGNKLLLQGVISTKVTWCQCCNTTQQSSFLK